MNKTELINSMAAKSGLNKKNCAVVLDAFISSVEEALKSGDKVQLIGFGTFEVRERKARKGRNPQTGKEIDIPATKVPAFKAGKALKDAL